MIVPDAHHQQLVLKAIHGAMAVKAGFTEGQYKDDLKQAIDHLARRGADVIVLGCTELPLPFPQWAELPRADATVALLEPTMLLTAACVRHAQAARAPAAA